jgi:3-deoxy-D-manno-octulosonic-acid transferase
LLVPRHVERRNKIIALLESSGLKWHQRSKGISSGKVDICFADMTDELQILASRAKIAFVGKSLVPNSGGHTSLDAACHGVPIIHGHKMTNVKAICLCLEHDKCVGKIKDSARAIMAITKLAKGEDKRKIVAKNLQEWHKTNWGHLSSLPTRFKMLRFLKSDKEWNSLPVKKRSNKVSMQSL